MRPDKYLKTAASDKTIVKVWISKYATTKGLYEEEGYVSDKGIFVAGEFKWFQPHEFHSSLDEAKDKALKSLHKADQDAKRRIAKFAELTDAIRKM